MNSTGLTLRMSARNVWRNSRRSSLVLLTLAMGSLGLFLFMGFNAGLMNQYRANTIRARYGHGELMRQGYRGRAHAKAWEQWVESPDDVMARLKALPGVKQVFPRVGFGAFVIHEGVMLVASGEGIDGVAEASFFDQLNYVSGGDFKDRPDTVVLGQGLANGLGVKVDGEVDLYVRNIRGEMNLKTVTVTGIFHTGIPAFDDGAFRCPLGVAKAVLETPRVERFSVALSRDDGWPDFAREVAAALPELEAVSFDVLDEVYYRHGVDWLDAQFALIRSIILLVVFLGIFNMISVTVLERTAEIGTRRANGEERSHIALGQILEAAMLGVAGAAAGLTGAWLMTLSVLRGGIPMPPAPGISRSFHIFIELSGADAAAVFVLCVLTAVAGCIPPVWRATRMPIVQALRHA